jgi:hypothetical protein
LLHDIGKVGVPSEILLNPGPLTDEEWVAMRNHAAVGCELVGRIDAFAHLAPAVRASHERWDGGGPAPSSRTGLAEAIRGIADFLSLWDYYRVEAEEYRELDG